MTRPGMLFLGALIVTGGLTGASPMICALPGPFVPGVRQIGPARDELDRLIDRLGAFGLDQRLDAGRAVRRAPGTVALPALLDAAAGHADGFVRARALVLLSGYDDPRVPDQMEQALSEPNEQLRTIAFQYFERHPDSRLVPLLVKALDTETAELARPALGRALAAMGKDPRVQRALVRAVARADEGFRAEILQALGDYKASYAVKSVVAAASVDGPSRNAALLALGKIGDLASKPMLSGALRGEPTEATMSAAAALCLLGSECDVHRASLIKIATTPDADVAFPDLRPGAAAALAELAASGDLAAGRALVDAGVDATAPVRMPLSASLARFADRRPDLLVTVLLDRKDNASAVALLREGFGSLENDFAEEQFFARIRAAYFAEAEATPRRAVIQKLINELEF